MNRVQQMTKVQEEIYSLILNEQKELQCTTDEKGYLNELANLQQQLKESMSIAKTTIALVDAAKLRSDLGMWMTHHSKMCSMWDWNSSKKRMLIMEMPLLNMAL